MPKKKPSKKELSYEQLGRMLESIYDSGYIDHGRSYKMSFLKGVAAGFGGVIGATIVVTLLLWILSLFHNIPFLNHITDNVQCTIEQHNAKMDQPTKCPSPRPQ